MATLWDPNLSKLLTGVSRLSLRKGGGGWVTLRKQSDTSDSSTLYHMSENIFIPTWLHYEGLVSATEPLSTSHKQCEKTASLELEVFTDSKRLCFYTHLQILFRDDWDWWLSGVVHSVVLLYHCELLNSGVELLQQFNCSDCWADSPTIDLCQCPKPHCLRENNKQSPLLFPELIASQYPE